MFLAKSSLKLRLLALLLCLCRGTHRTPGPRAEPPRRRPRVPRPWRRPPPGPLPAPQCRGARRDSARSEERRVGKSVSVRVDLGGRRIIKKKKTRRNKHETNKKIKKNKKETQRKK